MARVILLLPKGASFMPDTTAPFSQKVLWHLNRIRTARQETHRLHFAVSYAEAALADLDGDRSRDADGFRRELAYKITEFALAARRSKPGERFRETFPELPAGRRVAR